MSILKTLATGTWARGYELKVQNAVAVTSTEQLQIGRLADFRIHVGEASPLASY
ncbi:hypothetical protein [Brevundimonas sp.]|uniref:hypothetical protein n=1 Tax=Brevundimonas sp. TaxID=1871086 RepID=UPI0035620479